MEGGTAPVRNRGDTRRRARGPRGTRVSARFRNGLHQAPETPVLPLLARPPESHEHTTVYGDETPRPHAARDTAGQSRDQLYLVGVVHQGAVVTVIAHAVPVRVSLVSVVHVRTVVPLVEDICGCSRDRQESTELFLLC